MKADELMIGDLVMFPSSIEKVQEISYVCGKGYCASFAASATLFPISIDKIKPIPLTPEILEKNGMNPFEIDKLTDKATAKWWHKSGDFFIKQYHFKHYNFKPSYSIGCHNHTLIEGIEYVHELQHALKLCGIGIEITL